jgi:hypothetical protein
MSDYFICPNCGAEVPMRARSCPECGSDENTGWSEDTLYDGLGLEFFDEPEPPKETSLFTNRRFLFVIALVALIAFLLVYVL